jgi:hypothetical protein
MRTKLLTLGLMLVTVAPAAAETIRFTNLVAASSFSTYAESGFTVTATSGNWAALTSFGNPAPFIQFLRINPEPTTTAQVAITAGASPFRFDSVDLYSSITPIPYVFTGLLNSSTVFTRVGTVPNTLGAFATVTSNQPQTIDTLLITLSNPATPCCGQNPVGLDNIVVTAVPEPVALLLLGTGVAAMSTRRRMKKRASSPLSAPPSGPTASLCERGSSRRPAPQSPSARRRSPA